MKPPNALLIATLALLAAGLPALADMRYVNVSSTTPTPPYLSWATAATNIQDAVNAAVAGDQILVTNGVYRTGGRPVTGRVVVYKSVTVQSVNGPEFTAIEGSLEMRCVYLVNGAFLSGFTLTNGFSHTGGGVWCQSANSVVSNCVLSGNEAGGGDGFGGGAYQGTLNNCTLTDNSAAYGGGAAFCTLNNCSLTRNSSQAYALGPLPGFGGGAYDSTLNNCTLTGNSASGGGGGAYGGTLNNCTLTGNSGTGFGGGAGSATLNNCTLTGNSAGQFGGGGAKSSTLNNCIAYFNVNSMAQVDNYSSCTLNYCCTTPLPGSGVGNLDLEPQLASASHLSANSPCIGQGAFASVGGVDIDGEPWANPPAIGCDEIHTGSVTGALAVAQLASYTNVATEFSVDFQALISGRVSASRWEFGDGTVVSNRLYASHGWSAAGDYPVILRAYNESYPGGVTATVTVHVVAAAHYVALDSVNPVTPYTSWATAATNLQDAVDAATVTGALVLVTNGVYQGGGKAAPDPYTLNRVAVDKLLVLRSVNGPQFTVINGGGTVRCVYLTSGASLSGFTLTNGFSYAGGGVWCESTAVVSNCVLSGNSSGSGQGGGAYQGTLNNCTLTSNSAYSGGGTFNATLNDCALVGNSASGGGGAYQSTLNNCTLTGNSASSGGGALSCTLNNCSLTGNSAGYGGGANGATLNNCTLSGNSAAGAGGGAYSSTLNNCIIYYNTAPTGANYDPNATLNFCCTTPLPDSGVGNLDLEPQLASVSHLSANSPCIGQGNYAEVHGVDIDGEPWANPPAIGCDEFHSGSVTGTLTVALLASYTNVATGFNVDFQALISGRVSASRWEFGDGTVVSNRLYASRAWSAAGDYPVILRAFNESYPAGVSATVTVHVVAQPVHYVAGDSLNSAAPYTSWATAATNIQDAVDAAATVPGALVLVTNGTYSTGGRAGNRVAVDKLLVLRSVNGPQFTVINGAGAVRCVYLTNGASLSGFTLTNGAGGVWCESTAVVSNCVVNGNSGNGASGGTLNNCVVSGNSDGGAYGGTLNNCTLSGNSAYIGGGAYYATLNNCTLNGNSASYGGGAYQSTLNNCTLTGNSATDVGGGAAECTLNNCTLTGNSAAVSGGGAIGSTLNNCIVYFNTAPAGANYDSAYYIAMVFNYCCTTPLPTDGVGNISADPQLASASHLSASSPCLGRGNYAAVRGVDIDGEPWANPPSIGCDEIHSGSVTGALMVAQLASYTNVAPGFPVDFQALISGRVSASRWEFDDGTVVSNRLIATHAWSAAGDYPVILRAYNESYPGGVTAIVTVRVAAAVYYVASDSAAPVSPYTSWATAATNIQDAVDAASVPGALVLVTNGVYRTGGRSGYGLMTNRVAVDKWLTVRSVNGPQATIIQGYQLPGTTNGDGAIRCVSLKNGTTLSGFTLTGGATRTSGDSNLEQSGGGLWCESAKATVSNCLVMGNSAYYGGGAYLGTLNNCALAGNSAQLGGGTYGSILSNCTLSGNGAAVYGGGAYSSTLNNCIAYYNTAPTNANYSGSTLDHCCTTPLPDSGLGNLDLEPQLASASHLSANSPCLGRGNYAAVSGLDIDGEPWANPPAIGCDEIHTGSVTGALTVALLSSYTTVAPGFPVDLRALISGRVSALRWEFGDGTVVSNRPYTSHAWIVAGDYPVILRAYNEGHPAGVTATLTVHVVAAVHHVAANSVNPAAPYASWATAARNLQDAVDAASVPGALVLVTNGTYSSGGRAGNRVAVDKMLDLRSVNGPQFTVINGGGTLRCVYLTNGASLGGFKLTNGAGGVWCESTAVVSNCVLSGNSGRGVSGGTLHNCVVSGNSDGGAYGGTLNNCMLSGNSASVGGGAYSSTLNSCTLTGNVATQSGGAAYQSTLNNCTLISNWATNYGGGAYGGTLSNCTMTNNSASYGGGVYGGTLDNCTLTANSALQGGGAYQGTLNNCTLTGDSASYGGAVYGGTLNSCTLAGNSAEFGGGMFNGKLNNCILTGNSANYGGGVYGGALNNSTLIGNWGYWAGGAYGSLLTNCTLTGNDADYIGGAYSSTLNNSIVIFNTATEGANYWNCTLDYCCTAPRPTSGLGNITNDPLFADYAGGNLHLQSNSPCINSAFNAYAPSGPDLDGNPRIAGGTVDIGAYEFPSPASTLSYAWAQQYGLPTNGSADFADSDGDGLNNWEEWIAGTVPTNALSALRLLSPAKVVSGLTVSWQSVSNRTYFLERATNLGTAPPFSQLTSNLVGQAGMTTYTDTNAVGPGPYFYRVGVQK